MPTLIARFLATYPGHDLDAVMRMPITWFLVLVHRIALIHSEAVMRLLVASAYPYMEREKQMEVMNELQEEIREHEYDYRLEPLPGLQEIDDAFYTAQWDRFRQLMGAPA